MALIPLTLDLLGSLLPAVKAGGCASSRVLSLGYPDILASHDQVRAIFGDSVASRVQWRQDSDDILRWHNAKHLTDRVPESSSLFTQLGWELDVVDITAARGGEIIHDLNTPIPETLQARYAVVLDTGTLEHCFNIGQAAMNVAHMVALNGAVLHGNPVNMYNHGFYNLNPTWYHDFYECNGFVVEHLRLVADAVSAPRVGEVHPHNRFWNIPENSTLLAVARRAELKAMRWPIQRKYRDRPALRG